MRKGSKKPADTLCWQCQNFSKCSWCKGKPIKGWNAEPTKITNRLEDGSCKTIDSFIVHECPEYIPDKQLPTTTKEIGKIIGKDPRTVFRYLTSKRATIKRLLKEKGYKLRIYQEPDEDYAIYYLERLENA